MPSAIFERIMAELSSGELDERSKKILFALQANPLGLTRAELVRRTDGYVPANVSNDANDRKNRLAIDALRDRLIPIVSSSGESGYRLDATEERLQAMLMEMIHRRNALDGKIERIGKMLHGQPWKSGEQPRQETLFGG